METRGKTAIIDSDFRAGAIFYSLTNALLFSFAVSCTIVFARLTQKNNQLDGVNVLAMSIISGIVSVISAGLFIYSIYKLIKVAETREKINNDLNTQLQSEMPPEMPSFTPTEEKLRDLKLKAENQQRIKLPSSTRNLTSSRIINANF